MIASRPSSYDQFGTDKRRTGDLWIPGLAWLLVLLACALSISPNVADPDLWGHVQYGRDIIAERAIPVFTKYSFTAENQRWINHENLSEIIMAWVADTLGPLGLVQGKLILGMLLVVAMVIYNHRQGIGMVPNAILALLVSSNLAFHWSIRPQLATFVCFAALLIVLQRSFAGWRDHWHLRLPSKWFDASKSTSANELGYDSRRLRLLWLVFPIFVVWTNSHGGFAAGLAILGLYLLMRAVEALSRRGSRGWGLTRRMVLMLCLAVLASLINPYSFQLHSWLVGSVGTPRPEILDWQNFQLFTIVGFKFWLMLGVAGFALLASKQKQDATQLMLMSVLLWQSLLHFRHVPFLALMIGFWVGPHLQAALQRFQVFAGELVLSLAVRRLVITGLTMACGIVAFCLVYRANDLRVERSEYPVAAMQFMHDHNIRGRMVVTFNWAQYAIAAFCVDEHLVQDGEGQLARSSISFDGRFRTAFPQTLIDAHFDFLYGDRPIPRYRDAKSGSIDPQRILEYGDPEIVLLARFGEYSQQNMQAFADRWVLLYQDEISQVWGTRQRFDQADSPDYIPVAQREIGNTKQIGSVTWPALPVNRNKLQKVQRIESSPETKPQEIDGAGPSHEHRL
ncbi:MAG TPA: hypothetical protein PKD64_03670 [Pirellulaceae bacterium]|nr:hypothetical protein [Pirellulaceae bacterium]HMO91269.1 hypothetical protein [Pirellulaceae bacterium]HMP68547.1 hypothetical protein [Pirellulaceae bacterium]